VGMLVGDEDGSIVGCFVGLVVGIMVGRDDGSIEGSLVG